MKKFTNAEKAQELKRELGQRRYVYARRVSDGKMKQEAADRLIAICEEMRDDYEALAAQDTPDLFGADTVASSGQPAPAPPVPDRFCGCLNNGAPVFLSACALHRV